MSKSIVIARRAAFAFQSHRCFYCGIPIWETSATKFAQTYRITSRQALLLRCTAEHLRARSEGGPNNAANIVAACACCNQTRHKAKIRIRADYLTGLTFHGPLNPKFASDRQRGLDQS